MLTNKQLNRRTFLGEFYDVNDNYVGHVFKLAPGRFVIADPAGREFRFNWISAEFPGRAFKKIAVLDLGYARVNRYTGNPGA